MCKKWRHSNCCVFFELLILRWGKMHEWWTARDYNSFIYSYLQVEVLPGKRCCQELPQAAERSNSSYIVRIINIFATVEALYYDISTDVDNCSSLNGPAQTMVLKIISATAMANLERFPRTCFWTISHCNHWVMSFCARFWTFCSRALVTFIVGFVLHLSFF